MPRPALPVLSLVVVLAGLLPAGDAIAAAPIVVNSPADPGSGACDAIECTLREAIAAANAAPGTDTITFAIGSGPKTIKPAQALPVLTQPAVVDGTTQPGFSGTPLIEIDGSLTPSGSDGLTLSGGSSTVSALVINRFTTGAGILLRGGGGNAVRGCFLGTDRTGTIGRANFTGVEITSAGNVVGGTSPEDRNVLSGNVRGVQGASGVRVEGSGASGNRVLGNFIGVDASGTAAVGNGNGVTVLGAPGTVIGGTEPGAGNLVSGNAYDGIRLLQAGTTGTIVQGNVVGLDVNGQPLGNVLDSGVRIKAAKNTLVGGTSPGAGNVLSANEFGIRITERAQGTVIQGNRIGTDATGVLPRGNGLDGISLKAAPRTTVGGEAAGAANAIAFNGAAGVAVLSGKGADIRSNTIHSNAGLGIDLGPAGVTANDPGDGDTGANTLQNWPVVTAVSHSATSSSVSLTLGSIANRTYRVQVFASAGCDPSGNGEGTRLLGSASVSTGGSGSVSFQVVVAPRISSGEVVTATATDPSGNTSELSACRTA